MSFVLGGLAFVIRWLGRLIMLLGLAAFGFAAALWIALPAAIGQPLGQVWYQHDPFAGLLGTASLPLLGAIIERKLHPALWNPGLTGWLGMPALVALLVAGLVLVLLGLLVLILFRRRARRRPEPILR